MGVDWGAVSGGVMGLLGNYIGGRLNQDSAREAAYSQRVADDKNAAMQREFARNGVQWRVEDARRAGINPLVALGASVSQAAPTYTGDAPDFSQGEMVSRMGQDVSRAIHASSSQEDRAYDAQVRALTLRNMELKNAVLTGQAQDALGIRKPGNPPFPSSGSSGMLGQSKDGLVVNNPVQKVVGDPTGLGRDPGTINDYGFVQTPTGLAVVPSKDAKERIEDQIVPETMWSIRNQILPVFSGPGEPSKDLLPKGASHWEWNAVKQEYQPVYGSGAPSMKGWDKASERERNYMKMKREFYNRHGY